MIRIFRVFLLLLLLSGEESRTNYNQLDLPTVGCDGRANILFAPHYLSPGVASQCSLVRGAALAAVILGLLLLIRSTKRARVAAQLDSR